MKKNLLIVLLILSLPSCDKKQPILGERKDIFLNNTSIQVSENRDTIKVSESETFTNYYGNNSLLNSEIENYKVNSLEFNEYYISSKKFGVKNYFFSSPVIVDGIIYYLDTYGHLVAKNINNMKKALWKVRIIDRPNLINYYGGKLSFYSGTIYATTRLNEIIAINRDGSIKWRKKLNTIPISTPVIQDNSLYVITNDNKLYALDTDDGRIKWISYGNVKDSAILGSANPVIYGDYVIASYSSGELFILNKNTGETIFNLNLTGKYMIFSNFELTDIDSTPVIKDDILIATANNGITVAINLETMKVIWRHNLASLTNILIDSSFVYLMTTDNIVVCLNLTNGQINWFTELDKYKDPVHKKDMIFYRSIALINGKLYAFNNVNQYKIINPINGKLENTITTPFMLYTIPYSLNNKIYGIGLKGRKLEIVETK